MTIGLDRRVIADNRMGSWVAGAIVLLICCGVAATVGHLQQYRKQLLDEELPHLTQQLLAERQRQLNQPVVIHQRKQHLQHNDQQQRQLQRIRQMQQTTVRQPLEQRQMQPQPQHPHRQHPQPLRDSNASSSPVLPVDRSSGVHLRLNIEEECPVDTVIGSMSSLFNGPLDRRLSFRILSQTIDDSASMELFRIDAEDGRIQTNQRINREQLCSPPKTSFSSRSFCLIRLEVLVHDKGLAESPSQVLTVTVDIRDINDHSPVFEDTEITLTISEASIPGAFLSLPVARDRDSQRFGVKDYRLFPVQPTHFRLISDLRSDQDTELRLELTKELDREQTDHYLLHLVAYDGGDPVLTGQLDIRVIIVDYNDNAPKFDQSTFEVSVSEDLETGSTICQVMATDRDIGTNGLVRFYFDANTRSRSAGQFRISNDTGHIELMRQLDFESATLHQLHVIVTDSSRDVRLTDEASVVIHVTDVNDNQPIVTVNVLTESGVAEVSEEAPSGTFVAHVRVTDPDDGLNGQTVCSLERDAAVVFRLEEIDYDQYKITTAIEAVDREATPEHRLSIVCSDLGSPVQSTVVELMVSVIDSNDNRPCFSTDVYEAFVFENNLPGQSVAQVEAFDRDEGLNAIIRYAIDEKFGKFFDVHPSKGIVTAKVSLDREMTPEVNVSIMAFDLGSPSLTSSALLLLTIRDVDDEIPQFVEFSYSFGVLENQPRGTEVGCVRATDADTPEYARVFYGISKVEDLKTNHGSVSFSINATTGVIYADDSFDRESRSVYWVTAHARSGGVSSSGETSSVLVTIHVIDVNDNDPEVIWPRPEMAPVIHGKSGHGRLMTVIARDADAGDNSRLSFSISQHPDSHCIFLRIDQRTGVISITTAINKSTNFLTKSPVANLTCFVEVTIRDHGAPVRKALTQFYLVFDESAIRYGVTSDAVATGDGSDDDVVLVVVVIIIVVVVIIVVLLVITAAMAFSLAGRLTDEARNGTEKANGGGRRLLSSDEGPGQVEMQRRMRRRKKRRRGGIANEKKEEEESTEERRYLATIGTVSVV